MHYLLDTNAISDMVKRPSGPVAGRVAEVGDRNIMTSIVGAAEVRFGVAKRQSMDLQEQAELVLGSIDIQPFVSPADRVYGALRWGLERRGLPVGANDMLIAAHALALDCVLVTDNVREFSRIDGLAVENWLR